MTTQLETLRNMTVVVADTGDIEAIKKIPTTSTNHQPVFNS